MTRHMRKPLAVVGLLLTAILACGIATSVPLAAGPPGDKPATEGDQPAPEKPAKRRGRLPAYFAKIVTPKQREEIYLIQEEFAPQIEDLVLQLQTKIAERDATILGVLSPDQVKQIHQLKATARDRQRTGQAPVEPAEGDGPADANE